jgi:glycerophosphoryl diester phosphodiesterase
VNRILGALLSLSLAVALLETPAPAGAEEPAVSSPSVGRSVTATGLASLPSAWKIAIHAHRGGPELGAPENSIKLFRLAIAAGADFIETDVRITKDKKLVLIHDAKLPAGCTSKGKYIHKLTLAQVKKVRCDGEPIPTLQQAFNLVKGTGVGLNLELKTYPGQSGKARKDYAKRVAKAAKGSGLGKRVMFSSQYWREYATTLQKYAPKIYLLAMEAAVKSTAGNKIYSNIKRAKKLGVDGWAVPVKNATADSLRFARALGLDTELYGRNNDSGRENRFALANAVSYYLTDHPIGSREKLEAMLDEVAGRPLSLRPVERPLEAAKQVFSGSLKKGKQRTARVIGGKAPLPGIAQYLLLGVQLKVTISGSAKLELAPAGSRVGKDGIRIKNPSGTHSYDVVVSPGDQGNLRVLLVSGKAKVKISVTGRQIASY